MRSGTGSGSRSGWASRALVAVTAVAVCAACGGHRKAQTTTTQPPASIRVRLTADSHRPRVGKPWHYEVRVTDASGKPVAARIHLQILFGGTPVGQVGRHRVANGVWQETIGAGANQPFPARARNVPLVFEAVVTADGQTKKVDFPITVR
jgi:hypothetical protein